MRQYAPLLWRYFLRFLQRDAVNRSWLVVFAGTFVRLTIGFLSSILLVRTLGPVDYGIYAVLGAVITVGGGLFEFGLTETAVKYIAAHQDTPLAQKQAQLFVWLRLLLALAGIGAALLLLPLLASWLGLTEDVPLLLLALLAIGVAALNGALMGVLQSRNWFTQLSIGLVFSAVATLIITAVLLLFDRLTLVSAMWMGIIVSLLGSMLVWRLLPPDWRQRQHSPLRFVGIPYLRQESGTFLRYGRWLWLATTLTLLASYLDIFLIQRWLPATVVGIYALALSLASKAQIANSSLRTVLLPAAAKLRTKEEIRHYWRRGLIRSGGLSLAILFIMPIAMWFLPRLYGAEFATAVPLLGWLLGIVIFDIFVLPTLLLVYAFDQPHLVALSAGIQVATFLLLGAWLIPDGGALQVVAVRFVAKVVATAVLLPFLRREYRHLPDVAYYRDRA